MVKNKGGNKTKGRARKNSRRPRTMNVDDLRKIDGQEYAHALDKLGDGRFRLICYDKVARLGILRGTLKRFARCDRGAFVLVSIRDFEDSKCDIIHIYGDEDTGKLINSGDVNSSFVKEGKLIESSKDEDNFIDFGGASNNLDIGDEKDNTVEHQVNWLEEDTGTNNNNKDDNIGINIDDLNFDDI